MFEFEYRSSDSEPKKLYRKSVDGGVELLNCYANRWERSATYSSWERCCSSPDTYPCDEHGQRLAEVDRPLAVGDWVECVDMKDADQLAIAIWPRRINRMKSVLDSLFVGFSDDRGDGEWDVDRFRRVPAPVVEPVVEAASVPNPDPVQTELTYWRDRAREFEVKWLSERGRMQTVALALFPDSYVDVSQMIREIVRLRELDPNNRKDER